MYQVGSACYGTTAQAAAAAASSQVGAVVAHGSAAYVVDVSAIDSAGASITYALYPVVGGAPIVVQTPFSAQPCGLLGVDDGLAIGWGIAAAWLVVFALLFLTRGLRDGNT